MPVCLSVITVYVTGKHFTIILTVCAGELIVVPDICSASRHGLLQNGLGT